jgi:hypothetical protein
MTFVQELVVHAGSFQKLTIRSRMAGYRPIGRPKAVGAQRRVEGGRRVALPAVCVDGRTSPREGRRRSVPLAPAPSCRQRPRLRARRTNGGANAGQRRIPALSTATAKATPKLRSHQRPRSVRPATVGPWGQADYDRLSDDLLLGFTGGVKGRGSNGGDARLRVDVRPGAREHRIAANQGLGRAPRMNRSTKRANVENRVLYNS